MPRLPSGLPALLVTALLTVNAASCSSSTTATSVPDDETGAPPDSCAAGSMPSLASGACDPVGTRSCPAGFVPGEGGWGCSAIVPADPCEGATRAVIGETTCRPIDDCDAPFPPAGAVLVHDSTELAAALARSTPPPVVALEAGTYGAITTDQDVVLVGRCASKVIVQGPGQRGVHVSQDRRIGLRSMTIRGFDGGLVAAYYQPQVDASSLVLEDNAIAVVAGEAHVKLSNSVIRGHAATKTDAPLDGAVSVQIGGSASLDGVDIRDAATTFSAYDAPGAIDVTRSVVRYDGPAVKSKTVLAYRGGAVTVRESTVRVRIGGLASVGTDLTDGLPPVQNPKPGSVRFVDSELVQRGADRTDRPLVLVSKGATFALDNTTLVHQSGIAILGGETGTKLTLTDSVVRAVPTVDLPRIALMALEGTTARVSGTAVVDAWQSALAAGHPGASLALERSLVSGTRFGAASPSGDLGGASIAVSVSDGATLSIVDSAITASEQYGVSGEDESTVEITGTVVDGTASPPGALLGGVAVGMSRGARLAMQDSLVRRSASAALLFVESPAIVQNTRISRNGVAVHLAGASLLEVQEPPTSSDPTQVVFFRNRFSNNAEYERTGPLTPPVFTPPEPLKD